MNLPHFIGLVFCVLGLPELLFCQTPVGNTPSVVGAFTEMGSFAGSGGILASSEHGLNEIFLSSDTEGSFWHAHRFDPVSETYVQTFASDLYPSEILYMRLIDVHPSPGEELVLVLEDGDIHLFQQGSRKKLGTFSTNVSLVTAFDCQDWDLDGKQELALIGSNGLNLFDSNGGLIAVYPNIMGEDLVIGQMDGDASFEIAVTDGSVLDIDTGTIQCTFGPGFGFRICASDFDHDGMEELLVAEKGHLVYAFDVDVCSPVWSIPRNHTDVISIADSDQDGVDELILGDGQWGDISSFDLATQSLNWSIANPGSGTTSVLIADVNQDGVNEIVWGTTNRPNLFVGDYQNQNVEWEGHDLIGAFVGPVLGDVDGDGADEIVSVSRRSDQFKVGRLVVWEPDTLVTHISDRSRDASYYYDIQLFDVNEDGDQEILVAASGTLDAVIEIYDYAPDGTFSRIWKNVVEPDGSGFYSVAAADIDGNGTLEIIGGSGKRTSASDGTRIYVYDFATGFEKWHTIDLAVSYSSIPQLLIHDFDGDGTLEIAGMVENGDVSIFANNSALKATIPGKFHSMRLGPEIPGQSTPLLLGNKFGEIKAFQWKGSHFQEVVNLPLASDPIDGFTLLAQNQVLASIFGTLNLFDSNSGNLLWESKFYGTDFGAKVLPLGNGDYVTAGFSGLYILGIR